MSTAPTSLNLIAAVSPILHRDLAERRTDFKKGIQIAFLIIFTPPKFALDLIKQKMNLFFSF